MIELICPAGTPAALRTAVEAGADAVYCGFNDETNARNFPGLNFSRDELGEAIAFAHVRGVKILVAINTFPRASAVDLWRRAVDDAVQAGADALILELEKEISGLQSEIEKRNTAINQLSTIKHRVNLGILGERDFINGKKIEQ